MYTTLSSGTSTVHTGWPPLHYESQWRLLIRREGRGSQYAGPRRWRRAEPLLQCPAAAALDPFRLLSPPSTTPCSISPGTINTTSSVFVFLGAITCVLCVRRSLSLFRIIFGIFVFYMVFLFCNIQLQKEGGPLPRSCGKGTLRAAILSYVLGLVQLPSAQYSSSQSLFTELNDLNLIGSSFGMPGINGSFNYVVVVGRTAGLVMAARLAQNQSSVAVVEAGGFYEDDNGNFSVLPPDCVFFTGASLTDKQPWLTGARWSVHLRQALLGTSLISFHCRLDYPLWVCLARWIEHVLGLGREHFLHSCRLQLLCNCGRLLLLHRNKLLYFGRDKPMTLSARDHSSSNHPFPLSSDWCSIRQ